jgi:hypothetical protein
VEWWKQHKKYHLVNWDTVCTPKNQDGLGILDLRCMNNSSLAKWLWKLEKNMMIFGKVLLGKIH